MPSKLLSSVCEKMNVCSLNKFDIDKFVNEFREKIRRKKKEEKKMNHILQVQLSVSVRKNLNRFTSITSRYS